MSDQQAATDTAFVADVLQNNQGAIAVIAHVTRFLSLLSALERGEAVPRPVLRLGVWGMVVDLPCLPFYRQYTPALLPFVQAALLDLMAAGDLEQKPTNRALSAAYNARQSWCLLLQQCALLVGGPELAMAQASRIRAFANSQSFDDYVDEVARCAPAVDVEAPE